MSVYDLSACGSTPFVVSGVPVASPCPSTEQGNSSQGMSVRQLQSNTLAVDAVSVSDQGGSSPSVDPFPSSSAGHSPSCPILIDPVLAFVKAFRLKGDIDSIKRSVYERFSCELVESAKKALQRFWQY